MVIKEKSVFQYVSALPNILTQDAPPTWPDRPMTKPTQHWKKQ